MLKNKIKKLLVFSIFSGIFFVSGEKGSAVIRKAITSATGDISNSSIRKTVLGSGLNTWSSYKGRMSRAKSQSSSLQEQSKFGKPDTIQGKFINTKGNEIMVNVHTKISDEGLKVNFVRTNDGDEVIVTPVGNGFYARTLSLEEAKLFDKKNHGFLNIGIDTLGREFLIVVADGNSGGEIAFQFNNGVWRYVDRDKNRKVHLGHQVDMNSLSDDLRNRVLEDIKRIIESSSTVGLDIYRGDK